MRYTFRTKWENKQIVCVCTLDKKCEHARKCEQLDFNLNPYEDIQECMTGRAYKRKHGSIRQVRNE